MATNWTQEQYNLWATKPLAQVTKGQTSWDYLNAYLVKVENSFFEADSNCGG